MRKFTIAVSFAMGLGYAQAASAAAFLFDVCTSSCTFGTGGSGVSPGPTNADFIDFFTARDIGPLGANPIFHWGSSGTSLDGTQVGLVLGPDSIDTAYIFTPQGLICCTKDDPYRLNGINDYDFVVGRDPSGGGILGDGFIGRSTGSSAATRLTYDLTPDAIAFFFGISGNNLLPQFIFSSIDNENRVLITCYLNCGIGDVRTFELVPVPEPAMLTLFACGLGGVAALRRRKAQS